MPVGARGNGPTCVGSKGHFVLVKPLRPKGRTSGGGVKKCMTYCMDMVSESRVHIGNLLFLV